MFLHSTWLMAAAFNLIPFDLLYVKLLHWWQNQGGFAIIRENASIGADTNKEYRVQCIPVSLPVADDRYFPYRIGSDPGGLLDLKGSYDVAKKNINLCIWCNAMCLHVSGFKKHYFPRAVHSCCFSMLCLSETHKSLQSSLFGEARCALIGQLSSTL